MPFLALSAFILIVGCLRAFSGPEDTWICDNGAWVRHGNPRAQMPNEPCNSKNIKVTAPKINDLVTYPFVITGEARVFENQLNYQILDSTGKTIKNGNIMANSKEPGEFGPFEVKILSLVTKENVGTVEIFDYSAKDGSIIDKVIIPIRFK